MKLTKSEQTDPVTTIVRQTVLPGMEDMFEAWSHRIRTACRTYTGYQGTEMVRPVSGERCYVSIFRFDTYTHLEAWMNSDQRQALLEEASAFCEAPPHVSQYHSLEFMFPESAVTGKPPSRQKMALVTFTGLVAPVYFIPPLIKAYVTDTPILVTICSLAVIVPLMVYAIMPVLTRLFRPWLNR